jgi:hypothetical protein
VQAEPMPQLRGTRTNAIAQSVAISGHSVGNELPFTTHLRKSVELSAAPPIARTSMPTHTRSSRRLTFGSMPSKPSLRRSSASCGGLMGNAAPCCGAGLARAPWRAWSPGGRQRICGNRESWLRCAGGWGGRPALP